MHDADTRERFVTATEGDAGKRLDRFLSERLDDISRSRIKVLIEEGWVQNSGRTLGDANGRVKPGEVYVLRLPEPIAAEPVGEEMALDVVFEDDVLIVIDKPAGLVVHPGPGHAQGTLVNALIAHCGASLSGIGGMRRPGIVHRLDKDTSGLLVVAKTDTAHQGLAEQFSAHGRDGRLHRAYRALAWGVPVRPKGMIDARLGRHPNSRTKMAVVAEPKGREAVTHYEVENKVVLDDGGRAISALRLTLETGRTHQIRVHLAHIGHPVLGDPVYGAGFKASARSLGASAQVALKALGRQALHAAELGFEHPVSGEKLFFKSQLPADIATLAVALGLQR